MRTISVIGARISLADLMAKGWQNVPKNSLNIPYGMSLYREENGNLVLGYTIYDSNEEIAENNELHVETLFDLIDEFAHETNITAVKYITIQIQENVV